MIKFENFEVMGWEHAIRGMRNPLNSWDKSDTTQCDDHITCADCLAMDERGKCHMRAYTTMPPIIGPADRKLMTKLRNAGTDHRKFMRMITVYVDITAPLYWWKEFDTYKVGTVANSCSTMHTIHEKEFTWDDFSVEKVMSDNDPVRNPMTVPMIMDPNDMQSAFSPAGVMQLVIDMLNANRLKYLETKDKIYWENMIQLLPTSFNQKRTVMMNYEVLANIYKSRKNHKLHEWRLLCEWAAALPYGELITGSKESERLSGTEGPKENTAKDADRDDYTIDLKNATWDEINALADELEKRVAELGKDMHDLNAVVKAETSFQEDLDFFVNDCTTAQLQALYLEVGEKLREKEEKA